MSKVNAAVPPTANTIEKAVALYQAGEKQKALKAVAKMNFKTAVTKDEQKVLRTASEVLSGFGRMYAQMGIDTDQIVVDAYKLFEERFVK